MGWQPTDLVSHQSAPQRCWSQEHSQLFHHWQRRQHAPGTTAWSLGVLRTAEAERLSFESRQPAHLPVCPTSLSVTSCIYPTTMEQQDTREDPEISIQSQGTIPARDVADLPSRMWQGWDSVSTPPRLGGFAATSVLHALPAHHRKLQRCNVITEWLNPFHPWDWLGLIISSFGELGQSHSLKDIIQILSSLQT